MNAPAKINKNVYQRLNEARLKFHGQQLRKSGKFPKGRGGYFELADFIVPAITIFGEVGLSGIVSFGDGEARLDVVNADDPQETIRFSSPMGSASLAGCHEVQNIGAVQTYQRRYLWMMALEIVEHDALDSTIDEPAGGQSVEREVSPQQPAKGWRQPDSPLSAPTKLHAALCRLDHDLNGCGDSKMVYGVTATDEWREFVRVSEIHSPHYLRGPVPDSAPPEFEPLLEKAERLVAEFDAAEANNVADLARA